MTTFTVTTAADVVNAGDGRLSLREAADHRSRSYELAQALAAVAAVGGN